MSRALSLSPKVTIEAWVVLPTPPSARLGTSTEAELRRRCLASR